MLHALCEGLTLSLLPTAETNRRIGSCHIQGDSVGNVIFLAGNCDKTKKNENGEWKSRTYLELEEISKGENIVKWIKGQRISWLGHLEGMERIGCPERSTFKNWKGQDEGDDPGKDGKRK